MTAAENAPGRGDCAYPEWLAPGSTVTVISGRQESAADTTVERVGKRDIVLASGSRFSLTYLRGDTVVRHRGTWDPDDVLVPADSEVAQRVKAAQRRRRLVGAARSAAMKVDAALLAEDWRSAEVAYDQLGRHLRTLDLDAHNSEVTQ